MSNPRAKSASFEVRGRDISSGLPKTAVITTDDVVEALRDPLEKIAAGVQRVLETAPPELVSDVIDKGIIMTGGGALLRNFDDLLRQTTGIPVAVAENAADCVALGTGKALSMTEQLEDALVSDRFFAALASELEPSAELYRGLAKLEFRRR